MSEETAEKRRPIDRALVAIHILAAPLWIPSLILLIDPATGSGFIAGLTLALLLALPLSLAWSRRRRRLDRPRAFAPLVLVLTLSLAGLGALFIRRPQAEKRRGRVRSVYPRGRSLSLWDLVPEADQVRVGADLSFVDPWIDLAQSRRLRRLMIESYGAIAEDPELAPLGSSLDDTYADVLGLDFASGHLYDIRPPRPDPAAPLVIFVHGNVGAFKAYLLFWKRYSDRYGARVVVPSFGNGHWQRPGGVEAIAAARAYALRDARPSSITLIGLSNGGRGVGRAALASPRAFDRLVLISPVVEPAVYNSPAFFEAWKGRRVQVIHGAQDRRLPAKVLAETCAAMAAGGVDARLELVADEDHFLLLSDPERVLAALDR